MTGSWLYMTINSTKQTDRSALLFRGGLG